MTLAAARCDEALNNPTGETEKVVRAAHLFMEGEMEAANLDYAGFQENLMEAVDCYELAIDVKPPPPFVSACTHTHTHTHAHTHTVCILVCNLDTVVSVA